MANFNIVLDKRVPLKGNKYNLVIQVCHRETVTNLIISKITEKEYNTVFKKKSKDQSSIDFRETCNGYISRCERIFSDMKVYDRKAFRELFFKKDPETVADSLLVKDLFQRYIDTNDIKLRTKVHFHTSGRALEKYQPNLSIMSITPDFLKQFEKHKLQLGCSPATIGSLNRDLRRVINHFTKEVKIIPKDFEYPFGRGKFSIGSYFPKKQVLSKEEIKIVVTLPYPKSFDRKYAMIIFKTLYYANGMNFADLFRIREDQIGVRSFLFTRKKTETTRKNNISPIEVPLTEPLLELFEMIRSTKPLIRAAMRKKGESPYLLGLLEEGYSEETFENILHKVKLRINRQLTTLSKELNLSIPLKLQSARDCYASTLFRGGVSKDQISSLLGHSNSIVTEHYLASMDLDAAFDANSVLIK